MKNYKVTADMLNGVTVLKKIEKYLPEGITKEDIVSVDIPKSVIEIGGFTFMDCESLKSIVIPNSVTKIWDTAFANCFNLKSVTIPNSATEVSDSAFWYCDNLRGINCKNWEERFSKFCDSLKTA